MAKRSSSPRRKTSPVSRSKSPSRVSSKRSSTRSRSGSPSRPRGSKKSKQGVVVRKKSRSPSPVRSSSPGPKRPPSPAPKRPSSPARQKVSKSRSVSKSPSRSSVKSKKFGNAENHAEYKRTTVNSLSSVSSPSYKKLQHSLSSGSSTSRASANGMSFCDLVSATKSKGVSLFSDLFSPKGGRKSTVASSSSSRYSSQSWTCGDLLADCWSKICKPFKYICGSQAPVRGSFSAHKRSSLRRWFRSIDLWSVIYILFFLSLGILLYMCYYNLHAVSVKLDHAKTYAKVRFDDFSDHMLNWYDEWKYGSAAH